METLLFGTVGLTALLAALSLLMTVLVNLRVLAIQGEQRNAGGQLSNLEEAAGRANSLVQLELASIRDETAKTAKVLREELITAFATLAESVKAASPASRANRRASILSSC